jgi:hypothetical protein
MKIIWRVVGIDKRMALEVPDRIYHSAAFLNQLLSQTALAQEIRGGDGALPLDYRAFDRRAVA